MTDKHSKWFKKLNSTLYQNSELLFFKGSKMWNLLLLKIIGFNKTCKEDYPLVKCSQAHAIASLVWFQAESQNFAFQKLIL